MNLGGLGSDRFSPHRSSNTALFTNRSRFDFNMNLGAPGLEFETWDRIGSHLTALPTPLFSPMDKRTPPPSPRFRSSLPALQRNQNRSMPPESQLFPSALSVRLAARS